MGKAKTTLYQTLRRKAKKTGSQKQTIEVATEEVILTDVIVLEDPKTGDGLKVKCTCGELEYGPTEKINDLGAVAKAHAEMTGHILRPH